MHFDKDFRPATIKKLREKGITIIGLQAIPDMSSEMPWANASTGYILNDNGTSKVRTFSQVLMMAEG